MRIRFENIRYLVYFICFLLSFYRIFSDFIVTSIAVANMISFDA